MSIQKDTRVRVKDDVHHPNAFLDELDYKTMILDRMSLQELEDEYNRQHITFGAIPGSFVLNLISVYIARVSKFQPEGTPKKEITLDTPDYYDNSKGSLYKVSVDRNWNGYLFDVVKRLERGGKKDPLKQEIEKSINVLQLWLREL